MRDLPDGPTLLALASEWNDQRLDALSPEEHASMRAMILRARAIAEREATAGDGGLAMVQADLRGIYGEGDSVAQFRRLTDDIRTGRFDPEVLQPSPTFGEASSNELHEQVTNLLWTLTLQKLRESNPDFLAAHGLE